LEPKATESGLTIILRGTAQLERYPDAKAAFIRAADAWELAISTSRTLYIDVDFGPTDFGSPFDDGVLGETDPDLYVGTYSSLRATLIDRFPSDSEIHALPATALPTDLGLTTSIVVPSAVFRVLDLLPPASQSDSAPAIGFNSAFDWDFDPYDGVGAHQVDFGSTATHEIGHALGFTSQVGSTELFPYPAPTASVWDFNRFRPGAVSFGSTNRVLSSGGQQVYESKGSNAPLSTGRLDGTGGDGNQASHWEADEILRAYVGIMDPTLADGERDYITGWDLYALYRMGYGIKLYKDQAFIQTMDPSSAPLRSGGTRLFIAGEDIAAGAVVLWRGQPRAGTIYSEHAISIDLSAQDLAQPGEASVEVQNPDSVVSNALYFRIGCFRCTRVVSRAGGTR
jgi:hypothetical protein